MAQGFQKWAITNTHRGVSSKGPNGVYVQLRSHRGPWGHNLKLTLDILELFILEDQKKVLGALNGSFLSMAFLIFLRGPFEKSFGNPALANQANLSYLHTPDKKWLNQSILSRLI